VPNQDRLFSERQTCRRLKKNVQELRRLVASRRYDPRAFAPPIFRNSKVFFRESDIAAWRAYRETLAARLPA
jgi:hypothetical protein